MDRGAWQATVHGVTKSRTRETNNSVTRKDDCPKYAFKRSAKVIKTICICSSVSGYLG